MIGFGGMECRSFDGRVGRHKFAMGAWAVFLHGHTRCGIGEHWGGVTLANLGWLEKVSLVYVFGGDTARRVDLHS